jgi:tetratricopeptide (TPR) repeat protein
MKSIFTFSCLLILCGNASFSQNKIYLQDEIINGKVIEITTAEIKYKTALNSSQVNSVSRNKTVFLFNDKGGFLVVSNPDFSNIFLNKELTDNFINPQSDTTVNADKILTRNKEAINCTVINEDIISLIVNINGARSKIDKSTVAVVIYKNGEHEITCDIKTAADVLYTFQMQNKLPPRSATALKTTVPVAKDAENFKTGKNESPKNEKANVDSMVSSKENDRKYFIIIESAKSLVKQGKYSTAKYFYSKAHELKPGEREPLDGIASVDKKLSAIEESKSDSAEYVAVLATADNFVNLKRWDSALVMYRKAASIRPQEYYPPQQIKYVQSEIDKLKTQALETKFNNAMERADIAVKEKRYEDALAAYKEALTVHPDSQYAIDRAKILAYQVEQQKKEK